MAWLWLVLAGLCEMVWPVGFKLTNGFTTRYPLIAGTAGVMILSFYLMSLASRGGIPVGTTYAVWTGIGAAGTVILGIILFHESRDLLRLMCLSLIILGVIGLKLHSKAEMTGKVASVQEQAE